MTNKSLVTVQILDLLGNPIPKVQYEVKNSKTGQHVVRGLLTPKDVCMKYKEIKEQS